MNKIPNREFCIANNVKQCNRCERYLAVDSFGKKKRGFLGVKAVCKKCLTEQQIEYYANTPEYREYHKSHTNEWRRTNKGKVREMNIRNRAARNGQKLRRRTMKKLLPTELSRDELKELLIGSPVGYQVDHFIPVAIGHGGTYIGNLIILPREWNLSKGAKNPFEWCRHELAPKEREIFMSKVRYLAKLNGMSLTKFKEYTYWCFENPRSIAELKSENERIGSVRRSVDLFNSPMQPAPAAPTVPVRVVKEFGR